MTQSYIVTDALGELGSAVAARLARDSVRLCLSYDEREVQEPEGQGQRLTPSDLTERLSASGAEVEWIPGRFDDPETAESLMRAALDGDATLAGVVGCANAPATGRLLDVSPETWRATADTHLTGMFLLARAFGRAVRLGHPAALVLITSPAGLHPIAGASPLGAISAGVAILAQCVALETAKYGGRAYAVSQWATTLPSSQPGGYGKAGADLVAALATDRFVPLPSDLGPNTVAELVDFLIHTPEQLASIVESAGNQVASYRRTPRLTFALREDSTPADVLSALNGYAQRM